MDELQLSNQLVDNIINTLAAEDEQARNPLIASQYLAAIMGFIIGNQDVPANEKQEIMEHLHAFASHVLDDISQQQSAPQAQPAAEAFGIWKP